MFWRMKPTNTLFEDSIRPLSFDSRSSAKAAIMANPGAGDYILDMLTANGVLAVLGDGRLAGLARQQTQKSAAKGSLGNVDGEWKKTWPRRFTLIQMLSDGPRSLKEIREWLKDDKEPHGHWITLHALWKLIKDGEVVKTDEGYDQSPKYKADEAAEIASNAHDQKVFIEVLKKIGPPYPFEAVANMLRERGDNNYLKDEDSPGGEMPLDQNFIDSMVESAKRRGEL